ncbi:ParB/RepB/Spo0J family partition protein [Actinomadura rugatobispora]|uniref:ParB N-terminal domain-containing protein n=1 Tax=Actinomadura rugatobispora TaxID=1994 RepID=A0ABW1A9H4_9ACTN|nr:ParB N-terminal domain-containing protein [Actinomadura rugatobispora]
MTTEAVSLTQPLTELIPIDTLRPGDSPRLEGLDEEHVRTLAQIEGPLPPILVHRPTMTVIDGLHRLEACRLRGDRRIEARFLDGRPEAVFVAAVKANIAHGMPLTLIERKAAAERILRTHAHWADRLIAASTGLSTATVGALRERVPERQPATRIGRDGKARPLDPAERRRHAGEVIRARPGASLREIAQAAGISPATAHDVRKRLEKGEDPVPAGQRAEREEKKRNGVAAPRTVPLQPHILITKLRQDPALRFSDSGRELLRWLGSLVAGAERCTEIADRVPPHAAMMVAEVVRSSAACLNSLAAELERRSA